LDSEFLTLAVVFLAIGVAGVVLFTGPLTPTKDSCYCLIPSPEPGAAQGTASILLILGVLFLPVGFLKGGAPSFRRRAVATPQSQPRTLAVESLPVRSGRLYGTGIALIIIGVDVAVLPGLLLFKSLLIGGAGAGIAILGVLALYLGARS